MSSDLQKVCSLMQEHFRMHPDLQRERKVCVTIAAFYIFYNRAAEYAKLPLFSLVNVQQRLVTLFDTESILVVPECPEVESNYDDTSMILFQKINRYLFTELDSIMEQYLNAEMPNVSTISSLLTVESNILLPLPTLSAPVSNISELPVPPIEWATNIVEQLDYTVYLNIESSSSLYEWMKAIIDNHYDPINLIPYLQLGWNAILARYAEVMAHFPGTPNRAKLLEALIDRLRNTMCYPARISILSCALSRS